MHRLIFLFFLVGTARVAAQNKDSVFWRIKAAEHELQVLQQKAFFSKNEKERLDANKEFIGIWDRIITDPRILQYPFDSLKEISILRPTDKHFMLVTWNIPRADGTHNYFGFLLVNNTRRVKKGFMRYQTLTNYESFKLLDRSAAVKSPENYVGTPEKWFGMLYTQLIECDGYYTLLGWDGNDKMTQRKFVDALYFKSNGDPVFGKDIFRFPRRNPRRLMFECSQEISMSLRYNEKQNRIIFSHLAPRQEGNLLDGQYQFYGPDGSFDALEMKKERWVLVEDIDARNERSKKDSEYNNPKNPRLRKNKKMLPVEKTNGK
jgi:hypothetical protein